MGCAGSRHRKVFAKDAVIFVRDDHSSTEEQLKLARDLHKAPGVNLRKLCCTQIGKSISWSISWSMCIRWNGSVSSGQFDIS